MTQITDLPTPKGHVLWGHLPQFKANDKHRVLERWVEECGDLFRIRFVNKTIIVSANPSLNDEILRARPHTFRRFHKMAEIMEEMGVIGVFGAEGELWQKHRKPIAEALSLKKIRSFYPIIAQKTGNLLQKWTELAKNNEKIDVHREFMRYTVDITTAIAFGYELDTINRRKDTFQQHLEQIFPMINQRITAPLPTWRWIKQEKDRRLDASLEHIERLIYTFIEEAKDRLKNQPDLRENAGNFLEALLVEQENENRFDDREIFGNVFTLLLAGEDTTSNSIAWCVYYLAQHPQWVEKIREEAVEVYGAADLPENDRQLTQLKMAEAVVQEAMRLKPVTPNLYMEALEDTEVGSVKVPKGMVIMLQNKVAQTHAEYFSNPDDFMPERWLRHGCPAHMNHTPDVMRVFGGGPRYCPGKNLAMHEMKIALSVLCKAFDFELAVDPAEVDERFAFTMYPQNLWVQLTPVVS